MSGLFDFLQGASNAAASNLSGPIDLLAWGLRKAGVPVPENALLGSKWMEEKGLTKKPQNALAGLFGEAVGLSAPIAAAAKAPQIASGLLAVGDDFQAYNKALGPAGASQATVWHGSPHKFDRFDSSKIGTGEGAQAYGHGLYLAESPEVAKQYAGELAAARASRPIGNVDLATAYQNMPSDVPQSLLAARRDFRALNDMGELSLSDRRDFLEAVRNNIVGAQSGSLYKVDLPDEMIGRMLDWDKPLSQQAPALRNVVPDVFKMQEKIAGGMKPGQAARYYAINPAYGHMDQGSVAYELLKDRGGADWAAKELRRAGIPGIRYLDGGSRGTGSGTSNFVVFPGEENALRILERNGLLMP